MERWAILLTLTFARAAMAFQFHSVAALLEPIAALLGLGFAAVGGLVGAYLLPGTIAALAGGWAGQRFGDIATALGGLALMTAGGLVGALLTDFDIQLAARLVAGVGGVTLNVMVTKMAGDWFDGHRDLPAAMGVLVSSWPAGIALAMLVLPMLEAWVGLQLALLFPVVLSAAAFAALALAWRQPPGAAARGPRRGGGRLLPAEFALIGISGLIWGVYNIGFIAALSWGAGRLTALGMTPLDASAAASLTGWTAVFSVAAGGWLSARLRRPDRVALACFALSAVGMALFGAAGAAALSPAFPVLLGLVMGPAASLVMTLPVQAARPEVRALAMGIFLAIYYLVMGVAPALLGALRDATGNAGAPLIAGAVLFLSCIGLWAGFRRAQRILSVPRG